LKQIHNKSNQWSWSLYLIETMHLSRIGLEL